MLPERTGCDGARTVSKGTGRGLQLFLRLAMASAAWVVLFLAPSWAEVTWRVVERSNVVEGKTAKALVSSMNRNPVRGDHGAAYASIHPDYSLSISTEQKGGMCRASVNVAIRFHLTLPKAASPGAMSGRTRSAWNGFVNFARNHEEHHRVSYVACATAFVKSAERLSNKQCFALSSEIRSKFLAMKRDCEVKQQSFDRSQAQTLPRLALFSQARLGH